jgi:hypothetical protein
MLFLLTKHWGEEDEEAGDKVEVEEDDMMGRGSCCWIRVVTDSESSDPDKLGEGLSCEGAEPMEQLN